MAYTVKKLAKLAGVSVRTLHYYDEIGLLKPSSYGQNGYRYYEGEALLRLQQILFFRELDFGLKEIHLILEAPDFDMIKALQSQRQALQRQTRRLNSLIHTIDKTIRHLEGKREMSTKEMFAAFDEEKQKEYEKEARQRYGDEAVAASTRRWNSYSKTKQAEIKAEGEAIYREIRDHMAEGPTGKTVQQLIGRWHQHIRYFYEPTASMLRGLGHMYAEDPAFSAVYEKLDPNLPTFLRQAIDHYCDTIGN